MRVRLVRMAVFFLAAMMVLLLPAIASAHCDTLSGPVVTEARQALEKGDVTPVMKWIRPADEAEIRVAFEKTLAVRRLSPQAKELADRYFFETLVRLHRASEGEAYTGLKDEPVEPIVASAERAIQTATAEPLVNELQQAVAAGVRQRLTRVLETKKHMNDSVAAGREYVEAYVDYLHYLEEIHLVLAGHADHGAPEMSTTCNQCAE